jgi:hypothetical protein
MFDIYRVLYKTKGWCVMQAVVVLFRGCHFKSAMCLAENRFLLERRCRRDRIIQTLSY